MNKNTLKIVKRLLNSYSIETTPNVYTKYGKFSDIIDKDHSIYITYLPDENNENVILTAKKLSLEGFDVIPHLPARTIENKEELELFSNECLSSPFLYSMGLKSVILPGKTHPLLTNPFREFGISNEQQQQNPGSQQDVSKLGQEIDIVKALYKSKQLKNLEVTKTIFNMFDELYQPFENVKDKTGYIRHMVFPIEMYKTHFENATSLRQSLTNFWADVTEKYGGFWRFVVGQSQNKTTI